MAHKKLNFKKLFEKYNDEFLQFDKVENKLNSRADLHAFLLLDKLCPSDEDMISASEHDELYLSVEPDSLAEIATEEQILELIRCGVLYDESINSFSFFA